MSKLLLLKAIESGESGIKEFSDYGFPESLLKSWMMSLSPEQQAIYQRTITILNERVHNPSDIWDVSQIKDGDRVQHRLGGKIGTASIKAMEISNMAPIHYIEVTYDDGTTGTPYPNQLRRI